MSSTPGKEKRLAPLHGEKQETTVFSWVLSMVYKCVFPQCQTISQNIHAPQIVYSIKCTLGEIFNSST